MCVSIEKLPNELGDNSGLVNLDWLENINNVKKNINKKKKTSMKDQ